MSPAVSPHGFTHGPTPERLPERSPSALAAWAAWPALRRTVLVATLTLAGGGAWAASLSLCDRQATLTPDDQDRLFRFAAVVKDTLSRSGQGVALIARSGLDLHRLGLRYSHTGIALQASAPDPWSVRQLYYACDERQSQLFDQGLAGFLLGTDNPRMGYVSLVFMPEPEAAALAQAALDKALALRVLAPRYSANAYPFSLRYQNCNQWVMEMLAMAWSDPPTLSPALAPERAHQLTRLHAQAWLLTQGYAPTVVDVGWRLAMWASVLLPFVHRDDHPDADLAALHFRVSMPDAVEAFVRQRLPQATRVELCHNAQHIVVHPGWSPVGEGCVPTEGDTVIDWQPASAPPEG